MYRRDLLIGLVALAASQAACQRAATQRLRIAAPKGVVPPKVLSDFKQALTEPVKLRFDAAKSMARLFQTLQSWQPDTEADAASVSGVADWVCLSDYWLTAAIQQGLIRPLTDVDALPEWADLPDVWDSLLRRDDEGFPSSSGSLWATPYRWGYLTIVYSRRQFDRLGWQPSGWKDLWNPDLERRISLPNHPRLALGIVLQALGYSVNDLTPSQPPEMAEEIATLRPQVKTYTSENYLESLITEDIWLAVGWSTSIRPVLAQYRQLAAIAPDPGLILSADVWVKPSIQDGQSESLSDLDNQWLSYWWRSDVSTPLSLFSQGLSPLLVVPENLNQFSGLPENARLLPTQAQLQNSEFIRPLPSEAIAAYTRLWRQLRGSE